jgi:glycine oxidase
VTDVVVVGGGVLGLATAFELQDRGQHVRVVDPGGTNASAVAAGMIAPAFEAVLETASVERARLLRAARDLWPDFAARAGLRLRQTGAVWRGEDAAGVAERLAALGFEARQEGDSVFTPDDWQVDARAGLASLRAAVPVVLAQASGVDSDSDGWAVQTGAGGVRAQHLVAATGAAAPLAGLPARTAAIIASVEPIRGQIGFRAGAEAATAERTTGGYVAPAAGGVLIGATMDAGRTDLATDAAAADQLTAVAARLGWAAEGPIEWRVGVRGATADGLPLAGWGGAAGLWLALAPRRNGWLLAPLVARVVADAIEGRAPGEHAAALDPLRFSHGGPR